MAKSASWSLLLNAAVADQASVEVSTPGYDAALVDANSVELAVGNDVVVVPDQATVAFSGAAATVTNLTGAEWASGETVYIYVEAKGLAGAGETLAAMQAAIDANASAIALLDTEVADLQLRVAALETPVTTQAKGR
jgi:hypothetical protein